MHSCRKILLIAIDTLNVDHIGCYGYNIPRTPTTPFLDSLAKNGAIFQKHYATDVPTPSSFTSMFSGLRGIKNGIIGFNNNKSEFYSQTPLLAECFSKYNFRTGMISNLQYPCPLLVRGFQDIYPPGLSFQRGKADEVNEEAIRWLTNHGNSNFFLFVHYWDPHCPYTIRAPERYKKMYFPGDYKNVKPDMKYFEQNKALNMLYHASKKKTQDPIDPTENLALYDANIRYVDDKIKELFKALRELKIEDETLIIITSDHGEAFGEYGFWDHWSSYRNISQIPLIFAGPDIEKNRISAYTQNVDLMPTLLELAAIEVPEGLCGKTMVALLKGEQKEFRKDVVVNSDATVIQRMYVKNDYALVHTLIRPVWDHIMEYELFDLTDHSEETEDISLKENKKTKEYRIALDDWQSEELEGRPDPLWLSAWRGGWIWKDLCSLLESSELEKLLKNYSELKRIINPINVSDFFPPVATSNREQ